MSYTFEKQNNKGRFKKGCIPWNKGKKGLTRNPMKGKGTALKSLICISCSKIYTSFPSQIKLGRRFCSKSCASKRTDRPKAEQQNRRSATYCGWRKQILLRDDFICKILDANCKGRLEVHHILNWVDYPELRFDVNNGITLCRFHHPRKRKDEEKLSPYFKELVKEMK